MYKIMWKAAVALKPKLELYNSVELEYGVAPHLTAELNRHKCSVISQILFGCLQLEVEVGRYYGTPRVSRLCKFCNNGMEDQLHFLFDCK